MEISNFPKPSPLSPSKPASGPARVREASASRGASSSSPAPNVSLGAFEAIQNAMNQCPDSRAEVIARGKALAADPNYPPAEVVGKLASLFVADAESVLFAD